MFDFNQFDFHQISITDPTIAKISKLKKGSKHFLKKVYL